jgi:hypothetical protein
MPWCWLPADTASMAAPESGPPPGPHPEPPQDLAQQPLPIRIVQADTIWYRLHPLAYENEPLYFGRGAEKRFAAPGDEYGVLYTGDSPQCAFVETFGRELGVKVIRETALLQYCLTEVQLADAVRLADLTGARQRRLGADARLPHGDYPLTQRWSLALWSHSERPDGLCWHSRLDDERLAIGIFDRARDKVGAACRGSLMLPRHRQLLKDILDAYDFGLL